MRVIVDEGRCVAAVRSFSKQVRVAATSHTTGYDVVLLGSGLLERPPTEVRDAGKAVTSWLRHRHSPGVVERQSGAE